MEFNESQKKAIETLKIFLSPSYGVQSEKPDITVLANFCQKKTSNRYKKGDTTKKSKTSNTSNTTSSESESNSGVNSGVKSESKSIDYKSISYEPPTLLLLGPGGSGKTTVISHVLNEYKDLSVIFCAFTNKATQVLKKMGGCLCMTIHKLLQLLPYYDKRGELKYSFSVEKLANKWNHFDVIIFDECSTISKDLYDYIMNGLAYIWLKFGVAIKCIFLGDFWQLPPVGEKSSVVFDMSIKRKIPICKLDKVMRSKTTVTNNVNAQLLQYIEKIKKGIIDEQKFLQYYPYNIVPEPAIYIDSIDVLYNIYMDLYNKQENTIILTYSGENCNKINRAVQVLVDKHRVKIIQRINKEYPPTMTQEPSKSNVETSESTVDNKLAILFNAENTSLVPKPLMGDDILSAALSGNLKYSSNATATFKVMDKKTRTMISVENISFKIGDRCTIDKPINISKLTIYQDSGVSDDRYSDVNSDKVNDIVIKNELYKTDDSYKVNKLMDDPMMYITGQVSSLASPNIEVKHITEHPVLIPEISTSTSRRGQSINDQFNRIKDSKTNINETLYSLIECDDYIYNGEIFEVLDVKDIKLVTALNTKHYNQRYFDAQILKVIPVDRRDTQMKLVINVNQNQSVAALANAKRYEDHMTYQKLVDSYTKCIAKVKYGYCLTVYKAQGSEWNNVLINLPSFYWSLKNEEDGVITTLFKATYTALTRASEKLYVLFRDQH